MTTTVALKTHEVSTVKFEALLQGISAHVEYRVSSLVLLLLGIQNGNMFAAYLLPNPAGLLQMATSDIARGVRICCCLSDK